MSCNEGGWQIHVTPVLQGEDEDAPRDKTAAGVTKGEGWLSPKPGKLWDFWKASREQPSLKAITGLTAPLQHLHGWVLPHHPPGAALV